MKMGKVELNLNEAEGGQNLRISGIMGFYGFLWVFRRITRGK